MCPQLPQSHALGGVARLSFDYWGTGPLATDSCPALPCPALCCPPPTSSPPGYYAYLNVADKMGLNKGKAKKAKKAAATPAEFDADEWVKNTNYDVQKRKAAAAGAKTKAVKA